MLLEHLWPLTQVILVDLMLAADNAIVIGLAASSVPAQMRKRVIFFGIMAAAVLRIAFALVTVQLLQIIGLVLAGGLLLLWVCWKLWRELRIAAKQESGGAADAAHIVVFGQPVAIKAAFLGPNRPLAQLFKRLFSPLSLAYRRQVENGKGYEIGRAHV